MKQKEKWAEAYVDNIRSTDFNLTHAQIREGWIAGFDFAKQKCVEIEYGDEPTYLTLDSLGEAEIQIQDDSEEAP